MIDLPITDVVNVLIYWKLFSSWDFNLLKIKYPPILKAENKEKAEKRINFFITLLYQKKENNKASVKSYTQNIHSM